MKMFSAIQWWWDEDGKVSDGSDDDALGHQLYYHL